MSCLFPKEVRECLQRIHDEALGFVGTKAIFYRNQNEFSTQETANNEADKFFERVDVSNTRNIFDDPFETNVIVEWPDETKRTKDEFIALIDDVPIPGKVKFEDKPTIRSYLKVPYTITSSQGDDKNLIVRLEIVRLKSKAVIDQELMMPVEFAIKRTDQNLHPDDTSIDSDVPNDFFS